VFASGAQRGTAHVQNAGHVLCAACGSSSGGARAAAPRGGGGRALGAS
jgi:hypothetical protein